MIPPETGIEHLRNVLQAFVQSARNIDDLTVFTPSEAAAIVVRVKAALRELEGTPDGEIEAMALLKRALSVRDYGDLPHIWDAAWRDVEGALDALVFGTLQRIKSGARLPSLEAYPNHEESGFGPVVQGARMDGASLGGQEPEHPVSETCPCEACLAAHGTYKPGHSGGLAF